MIFKEGKRERKSGHVEKHDRKNKSIFILKTCLLRPPVCLLRLNGLLRLTARFGLKPPRLL